MRDTVTVIFDSILSQCDTSIEHLRAINSRLNQRLISFHAYGAPVFQTLYLRVGIDSRYTGTSRHWAGSLVEGNLLVVSSMNLATEYRRKGIFSAFVRRAQASGYTVCVENALPQSGEHVGLAGWCSRNGRPTETPYCWVINPLGDNGA